MDERGGWNDLHSEVIFLQDVYPRFSLDHPPGFFLRKRLLRAACMLLPLNESQCRLKEGVGSYALSPSARRYSLGTSRLGAHDALKLISEWAAHWDLSRPILLEKSPSNALIGPLLSSAWTSVGANSHFIYVTRHPLMQAMAMRRFVDDRELGSLIENWLAVEESVMAFSRLLAHESVALLSLEAFATRPERVLHNLVAWLGICTNPWGELPAWLPQVRARPNQAYAKEYAEKLLTDSAASSRHIQLAAEFGPRVALVSGYQFGNALLSDAGGAGDQISAWEMPPTRDGSWLRSWLGRSYSEREEAGLLLERSSWSCDGDAEPKVEWGVSLDVVAEPTPGWDD